jgi:hypothetical protein
VLSIRQELKLLVEQIKATELTDEKEVPDLAILDCQIMRFRLCRRLVRFPLSRNQIFILYFDANFSPTAKQRYVSTCQYRANP